MHCGVHPMRLTIAIFLAFLSIAVSGTAQDNSDPWNRMYVFLMAGQVVNAAALDRQGDYQAVHTTEELEYGGGIGITLPKGYSCDIAYSTMSTAGKQTKAGTADFLVTVVGSRKLSVTLRKRFEMANDLLEPWYGGGFDANVLSVNQDEVLTVPAGQYVATSSTRFGMIGGIHVAAGVAVHPIQSSALALTVEARYTCYPANGFLAGNLDGFSCFGGLRWDFWQKGQ